MLFEHKSYLGADLVFQLLKYMANIWTSKIQKEKATVLPIILPIVIYHGAKPWNIKTSLGEMLPDFSGLAPEFKKHIPDFSYLLYNLPELTPTMLRGSPVLQVILKTMVIIFDQDTRKIVDVFLEAAEIWGRLPQSASNLNLFKSLTIYILYSRSDLTSDLLHTVYPRVEKTYPKGGELIVTLADRLKEEGRQEGHQEGRREGIENMIKNQILAGVNLDLIIKTSGLTEQEVLRLAQNLKDQEKNGQIII